MAKKTVHITVDALEWEQYKDMVDNASKDIRGYISTRVNTDYPGNSKRIRELESTLQEKREKKEEFEEEMAKLQRELSALKAKKKAEEKIEETREQALERFQKVFDNNFVETDYPDRYPDDGSKGWVKPKHIPDEWVKETGMSREELWNEVQEP